MESSLQHSFSQSQLRAVKQVHSLLAQVGLTVSDYDTLSHASSRLLTHSSSPTPLFSHSCTPSQASNVSKPSLQVITSQYIPPPTKAFTADERMQGLNRVNHKVTTDAIIEHPHGTMVEYPKTGARAGQNVAHIFKINLAMFIDPKSNFQYSLCAMGGTCGGLNDVHCDLLQDSTGNPVHCKHIKTSCNIHFSSLLSQHAFISSPDSVYR